MIDWLLLLKFSVKELKIQPSEFWQMTLKEFIALASIEKSFEDISDIELKKLIKKFPDKTRRNNES